MRPGNDVLIGPGVAAGGEGDGGEGVGDEGEGVGDGLGTDVGDELEDGAASPDLPPGKAPSRQATTEVVATASTTSTGPNGTRARAA